MGKVQTHLQPEIKPQGTLLKPQCPVPKPLELAEEPGLGSVTSLATISHPFPVGLLHFPALQAVWDLEQGFLLVPNTTLPLRQHFLLLMCSTSISGLQEAELGTAALRDGAECPQHPSALFAQNFHRFGGDPKGSW